jgi:hypothetical protein
VPQLIKWNGYIYDKLGCEYYMLNDRDITLFGDILDTNGKYLNDEVEIIEEDKAPTFNNIREQYGLPRVEEDKKIEKFETYKITDETISGLRKSINELNKDIERKLNEIIDKINESQV